MSKLMNEQIARTNPGPQLASLKRRVSLLEAAVTELVRLNDEKAPEPKRRGRPPKASVEVETENASATDTA